MDATRTTARTFVAGQKLWFVPVSNHLGEATYVAIKTVGRKWLTLENGYRADVETLFVDGDGRGYTHPAVCYIDKQAYDEAKALEHAWLRFRTSIAANGSRVPKGVTREAIQAARTALRMDEET